LPNLATPAPIRGLLSHPRVATSSDLGVGPVPSPASSPLTATHGRSRSESSVAARRAFARRRRALAADGRWGKRFAAPGPARRHLLDVMGTHEISLATAALLSGVGTSTLASVLYPEHAAYGGHLHVDTAAAVLALRVDLNRVPDGALLSSAGTRRRLEGLVAFGWPLTMMDDLLGLPINTLAQWRRRGRVTAAHARTVRDIYDDLSMQPGPSRIARRRAQSAGWLPPLAWNDEDLDNPKAARRPRRVLPASGTPAEAEDHPQLTSAESAVTLLVAAGGPSEVDVADRVGISSRRGPRWRTRAECPADSEVAG